MSLKPMKAEEIAKVVINQEKLFILDVRNLEAFNDWRIEGKGIESLNKPYFDLIDGVDEIVDKLPKDDPILVVCAKEGSSKFVGDMLVEAGFKQVKYLEGGMKSWSEHLQPVKVSELSNDGAIYQFVRLGKGCLSYLIQSGDEAIIIDPVRTIDEYLHFANERSLKIKHVIDTHLHADHISGARAIREETGAKYWLPKKDASEVKFEYRPLEEESDILFENSKTPIKAIYSPGHTIGSTSLIIDNKFLLTGDNLFVDSIGRPDLAGKAGDWATHLRMTLYERYQKLSKELVVLPGHFSKISELNLDGSVSEILGTLYKVNTGLNLQDTAEFTKRVSEDLPPQPNSFKDIRKTNMGKINPIRDDQQEMEIGPNRCAVN